MKHIKINHADENPYLCGLCGQTFKKCTDLNSHKATHSKVEDPISCDYCYKKCSNKLTLIIHERKLHTLTKPYVCHICFKAFFKTISLKVHLEEHGDNTNPILNEITFTDKALEEFGCEIDEIKVNNFFSTFLQFFNLNNNLSIRDLKG